MNVKLPARVKLHSFKYVNLILWENWLIILGIWGEAELIFRIWGAKEKYFQGAEEFSFRDLGRSTHYFQGSREHRRPWGRHHSVFACIIGYLFKICLYNKPSITLLRRPCDSVSGKRPRTSGLKFIKWPFASFTLSPR